MLSRRRLLALLCALALLLLLVASAWGASSSSDPSIGLSATTGGGGCQLLVTVDGAPASAAVLLQRKTSKGWPSFASFPVPKGASKRSADCAKSDGANIRATLAQFSKRLRRRARRLIRRGRRLIHNGNQGSKRKGRRLVRRGKQLLSDGKPLARSSQVSQTQTTLAARPPPDTEPPDTRIDAGPSGVVSSTSASFKYSSEPKARFECSLDGSSFSSCPASGKSYRGLADGSHTFRVRAVDRAGNVDLTPASRDWRIDTKAPDTTITAAPSGTLPAGPVEISFTSNESTASFECKLDAGDWAGCSSPKSYSSLAPGQHSFSVRAKDQAGNLDPSPASATWTVSDADTTPPDTTIRSGPSGRVPLGPVEFSFSSDDPGASFECSLDGASYSSCSSPLTLSDPSPGRHELRVRAKDTVGNVDPTPASRSWASLAPRIDLCGTLNGLRTLSPDEAEVYVVTCPYEIAAGAVLNVEPDVIVKARSTGRLSVDGTLTAVGTAADPITFTSADDNSVGGDTGDGSPAAGDWGGISLAGAGSIDLEHANVSYASVLGSTTGSVIVSSNHFASNYYGAVRVGSPTITLQDNTAVDPGVLLSPPGSPFNPPAYAVHSDSLNLGRLSGNTASGTGLHGIEVSGKVVTSTFAGGALPLIIPGFSGSYESAIWTLEVPADATMTIDPGAIIKAQGPSTGATSLLKVDGTLTAVGTAADPITFTSADDNSVGGDTGDGSPAAGDWGGISLAGAGSIDLEHANVSYASVLGSTTGSVIVSSNHFASNYYGAVRVGSPTITLQDNTAVDPGVLLSPPGSPFNPPAYAVHSDSLNLGRLSGNTASGTGLHGIEVSGKVVTSTFAGGALPLIIPGFSGSYESAIWTLEVPADATMTIDPGAIIKAQGPSTGATSLLKVDGTLTAVGTAADPITFTSADDNSVGGDTGDGSPAAGDWGGISLAGAGSIDLEHANVSYASTGLSLAGGRALANDLHAAANGTTLDVSAGEASLRGTIAGSPPTVRACKWGTENCSVDAAYVEWPQGADPVDEGLACGQVTVSPYLHNGSNADAHGLPKNCDGSPDPTVVMSQAEQRFNDGVAAAQRTCDDLGQDVCDAVNTAYNCLSAGVDVIAGTSPFPLPDTSGGTHWAGFASNTAGAGSAFLKDSESATVADFGAVIGFARKIVGVAGTWLSLANAYDRCAP